MHLQSICESVWYTLERHPKTDGEGGLDRVNDPTGGGIVVFCGCVDHYRLHDQIRTVRYRAGLVARTLHHSLR